MVPTKPLKCLWEGRKGIVTDILNFPYKFVKFKQRISALQWIIIV